MNAPMTSHTNLTLCSLPLCDVIVTSPSLLSNMTSAMMSVSGHLSPWMMLVLVLYSVIFLVGTTGNGMVIYVVARYNKMRSVTNTYIVNLALADICFLVGLPMLIVTAVKQTWIFGKVMCKLYLILTSFNWFASVFTLTVLSADRYFAVCHAVSSMNRRSERLAAFVCLGIWILSLVVVIPVIILAEEVMYEDGNPTCSLNMPDWDHVDSNQLFMWYIFSLAFFIPILLIIVFYSNVIMRVRNTGPARQTDRKKKSNRKITQMVFTVITVYIMCWGPYYIHQMLLLYIESPPWWSTLLFQFFTFLTYSNSALNPLLYAFLSDNFRRSFLLMFRCAMASSTGRSVTGGRDSEGQTALTGRTRVRSAVCGMEARGGPPTTEVILHGALSPSSQRIDVGGADQVEQIELEQTPISSKNIRYDCSQESICTQ